MIAINTRYLAEKFVSKQKIHKMHILIEKGDQYVSEPGMDKGKGSKAG